MNTLFTIASQIPPVFIQKLDRIFLKFIVAFNDFVSLNAERKNNGPGCKLRVVLELPHWRPFLLSLLEKQFFVKNYLSE